MITAKQAYRKAVTSKARKTLIAMTMKSINNSIDKVASDGHYEYMYNIHETDILRDSIINNLLAHGYVVKRLEHSIHITWSQE